MTMLDINQDGMVDLVVLIPYEKIKVLLVRKRIRLISMNRTRASARRQ